MGDGLASTVNLIQAEIEAANRIMVISHIRPDGDAVGSLLGLGLALEAAGKDVQMVLADGIPHNFRHLEGNHKIQTHASRPIDLMIVLDVSDLPRLGNSLQGYGIPDINIDHHVTNEKFARINLVEGDAAATAEIIANRLLSFGLTMTIPVANALLTGIITDTIGFRTSNVTPNLMRTVIKLMEAGASLSEMYYPALVARTFAAVRYWGSGLTKLSRRGKLVWLNLSLEDRRISGYQGNDDADLINELSAIEDADVAIILVEQAPSRVKISWRVCGQADHVVDVSKIAKYFGGGGHKAAAGAEIEGELTDVEEKVVGITYQYLADGLF